MGKRVLPMRDRLEVFVDSENEYVVIKQEDQNKEQSVILLCPGDIPLIVQWLQEAASEVKAKEEK